MHDSTNPVVVICARCLKLPGVDALTTRRVDPTEDAMLTSACDAAICLFVTKYSVEKSGVDVL